MISWLPIAELSAGSYDETFLLWCPALTVSGPAVTAYFINDEWVNATTALKLPPATHFARINPPSSED